MSFAPITIYSREGSGVPSVVVGGAAAPDFMAQASSETEESVLVENPAELLATVDTADASVITDEAETEVDTDETHVEDSVLPAGNDIGPQGDKKRWGTGLLAGIRERGWSLIEKTKKARRVAAVIIALSIMIPDAHDTSSTQSLKPPVLSSGQLPKHLIPRPVEKPAPVLFPHVEVVIPPTLHAEPRPPVIVNRGENDDIGHEVIINAAKDKREKLTALRATRIGELKSQQLIGVVEFVQTAGEVPNIVQHGLRVGALPEGFAGTPTAPDFDANMDRSLLLGATLHTYGAEFPGIDDEVAIGAKKTPIVIAMHHLTNIIDPLFPNTTESLRHPELTTVANPETGEPGDILTLQLVDRYGFVTEVRTYEAVQMTEVQADDPSQVFGSDADLVVYNCSKSAEQLAAEAANPNQHIPSDHRMAIFFKETGRQQIPNTAILAPHRVR